MLHLAKKGLTPRQRFNRYVQRYTNDCWIWMAALVGKGYGTYQIGGIRQAAHRWAYEFHHGIAIQGDMVIDHLCCNKRCVRPDHLELVTSKENTLRGWARRAA